MIIQTQCSISEWEKANDGSPNLCILFNFVMSSYPFCSLAVFHVSAWQDSLVCCLCDFCSCCCCCCFDYCCYCSFYGSNQLQKQRYVFLCHCLCSSGSKSSNPSLVSWQPLYSKFEQKVNINQTNFNLKIVQRIFLF